MIKSVYLSYKTYFHESKQNHRIGVKNPIFCGFSHTFYSDFSQFNFTVKNQACDVTNNLFTQWRSKEGEQVGARPLGRRLWGRIITLFAVI